MLYYFFLNIYILICLTDSLPQGASLLRWISAQLSAYQFTAELKEPSDVFRNGRVLCALISR